MPVSRSARANSCVAPRSRAREQRTLEVLGGDLLEREREHLEVVGRRVRPGAALAQDARERLAGAVEQSSGWKPKPRFQSGSRPASRSGCSRGGSRRQGRSPAVRRRPPRPVRVRWPERRASRRALLPRPRPPPRARPSARRSPSRRARLLAQGAEVREAVAAIGEAQRKVAQNPPAVVAARALAGIGEGLGEGACQPEAIGQLGDQRGPRAGHQSVSVRGDFYLPETAVLCHPQGDPPGRGLRTSTPRILPAQEDGSSVSGQPPRASAAERSGLGSSP